MSFFNKKLSELKTGTQIRLTQKNGQILDGIICENDGFDAIEIQISTYAVIRYNDIVSIEIGINTSEQIKNSQVSMLEHNSNIETSDDKSIETSIFPEQSDLLKFSCDLNSLEKAFHKMKKEDRLSLNNIYNKCQSAVNNHDENKLKSVLDGLWDFIKSEELEYESNINIFLANISYFDKDYITAAESFFYGNDIHSAYLSAYKSAYESNDNDLYAIAAVFSAIYISENDDKDENIMEAIEILCISSTKCNDFSGFKYIFNIKKNIPYIKKLLLFINKNCNINICHNISEGEFIDNILAYYSKNKIYDDIKKYLNNLSEVNNDNNINEVENKICKEYNIGSQYQGKIAKYNYFEQKGEIEVENAEQNCFFEVSSIIDQSLKKQVEKISTRQFTPILVTFKVVKLYGKYTATEIKRFKDKSTDEKQVIKTKVKNKLKYKTTENTLEKKLENNENEMNTYIVEANNLFTQQRYEDAISIYRRQLDSPEWESAFGGIINCILALWNQNGDIGYSEELKGLAIKYGNKLSKTIKNMSELYQLYTKVQMYNECLDILNVLIDLCDKKDYGKILHYLIGKEKCYRALEDIQSAIGQLKEWLEIVKKNDIQDRFQLRDSIVYIELAELYYEIENYKTAEKYAKLASDSERKNNLIEKLSLIFNQSKEDEEIDCQSENDRIIDENNNFDQEDDIGFETLQDAFKSYIDEDGLEALNISDIDVVKRISTFSPDKLYCLLTYISAISKIARKDISEKMSEVTETTVSDSIQALEAVYSYAFNNPITNRESSSTQLAFVFNITKDLLPDINNKLFSAASIRTLFNHSTVPDYELDDMILYMEQSEVSSEFPALLPLAYAINEFREKTGYGIDAFADYKTNSTAIEKIITEANNCCEAIDMRGDVYESQGQVRRARDFMFNDKSSELRIFLDIIRNNDTSKLEYVTFTIKQLFIRNNKSVAIENVDSKKIDKYVDRFWDMARDAILKEGRHIARPYDKIKGSKRSNIIKFIMRIIACSCEWVSAMEHTSGNDNVYAKAQYENSKVQICTLLEELNKSSEIKIKENGFDWGTESIRYTSKELLDKLNGRYDVKSRKYLFIDFLRGDDILLNDEYLPELNSTFCGLDKYNIIFRIENHIAKKELPSFKERINDIFKEDLNKSNYRSANLISSYINDIGTKELEGVTVLNYIDKFIASGKKRVKILHEDFRNEIELDENCGRISSISGVKDSMLKCVDSWYKISMLTFDFGFYANLIDVLRYNIAENAYVLGERLTRQLEELSSNPEYDFGEYSKEKISSFIQDQNYTVAENMMNCVRRNDTKKIPDFTIVPFEYLNGLLNEYATNYRIVADAGMTLEKSILNYVGKNNVEKALRQLTNNGSKDVRGGCNLISNWIVASPAGTDKIEKFLNTIGFSNLTVTIDGGNNEDSYLVIRKKQIGKINYPHPIPAFSSLTETEGFRVLCLYGKFDCNRLMDKFRDINTTSKNTIVLLDYALNIEERRRLARKIKEEKSFSKTFIVIDRVLLFYLAKHYATNTITRMLMATTMPFSYYQPFTPDSKNQTAPELFTGRKEELRSIEAAEGANLVYGGRQLGKSALLKMAQNNIDGNANGDRAVFVDIYELNYKEAAIKVSNSLVDEKILDKECEGCDDWQALARYIKNRLKDNSPEGHINYFLLMLDEADTFIKTCKEVDYKPIAELKDLQSGQFKFVLAGLHNLSRFNREAALHNNSIFAHLEPIVVRPFKRPEATELLTNVLAYLGFQFKDEVISLILAKTNYFPGLIQLYCQKLLEAMKNEDYAGYNEVNTPSYKVTENHIKKVLSDPLFTEEINKRLEMTLFVDKNQGSYYHIIALILAYLHYENYSDIGYNISNIYQVAKEYNILKVNELSEIQLSELLSEMWDLNILSATDGYYVFSTESFRELLGSREQVEQAMTIYIDGGEKY